MLKKCAIFGLVMMIIAGGTGAWIFIEATIHKRLATTYRSKYADEHDKYFKKYGQVYSLSPDQQNEFALELVKSRQGKTPQQLVREQKERLKADIDRLAAKQMDPGPAATMLYGPDWQNKVGKYAKHKELKEVIFTGSVVFTAMGAVIFAWCVLLAIVRLIIKAVSTVCKAIVNLATGRTQPSKELAAAHAKQATKPPTGPRPKTIGRKRLSKRSRVLVTSGWHDLEESVEPQYDRPDDEDAEETCVTESDCEEIVAMDSPGRRRLRCNSVETSPQVATSLKDQAQDLQEQIEQLRQMAQTVQQATLDQSNPINNTLKDLAEQMSAIREYAACQQDRVERLQDGYDWNIIKTFCLRVIRCIDNIEAHIMHLTERNVEVRHLKEIRDELIFALESSGVERFEPKVNSDYRDQEKFSEAVKEKVFTDNPELLGRIAQVVRPGYQYLVNDDSVKIIRAAQVKLFVVGDRRAPLRLPPG